jgi:hypothetical protein
MALLPFPRLHHPLHLHPKHLMEDAACLASRLYPVVTAANVIPRF